MLQHKSFNLLDTACEIEQNTDVRRKLIIQNNLTNFLFLSAFPMDVCCRSEASYLYLKTFDLLLCFSVDGFEFELSYALLNECVWEPCRRFAFDKLGPANQAENQRYVGDLGWMGDIDIHRQLVGTGRGMLATLLPWLALVCWKLFFLNLDL